MKKTNKVNPLTHFNNTKTAAYKKASKEMANYKKSLPKAQKGFIGPKTEWESILSNQPPIPRPNRPSMSSIKKYNPWAASIELKEPRPNMNVGIANAAGPWGPVEPVKPVAPARPVAPVKRKNNYGYCKEKN